jgi:pentatricopeptide repeat protein
MPVLPICFELQYVLNASKSRFWRTQLRGSITNKIKNNTIIMCPGTFTSNTVTTTETHKGESQNPGLDNHCRERRMSKDLTHILHNENQHGIWVDLNTYAALLQTCSNMKALLQGKQVHAHMIKNGVEGHINLDTNLFIMYTKCGNLGDARPIFDKMADLNLLSWTAMIAAYARSGNCNEALKLFHEMQGSGVKADSFVYPSLLKACTGLTALQQGKEIHGSVIRNGFESDFFVGSALVALYTRCKSMKFARQVFEKMSQRNEATWNAMLAGYAQSNHRREAMNLFREMQLAGVEPDSFTFGSVLAMCANLAALKQGKEIHGYIIGTGFELNVFVDSALVDMYAKCGSVGNARRVFDEMFQRDVVSWNSMVAGYVQNGQSEEALKLFREMQLAGVKADSYTISSIIPACVCLTALRQGKEIHNYMIRSGLDSYVLGANSLIDMYAKCGSILAARQVFDKTSQRDVISWNAMIAGYGIHGCGEDAILLFSQMHQAGLKPDNITFIGILSACSRAGLVNEGWQYFKQMMECYQIMPSVEHCACMVDLLGRAGHLDEAQNFVKKMTLEPDACVWGALLGACRIHHSVEIGEQAAQHLLELEPQNPGNYVLLSNIYAAAGRWNDVAKVRYMMKDKGLKKIPGYSWIEVKTRVHFFRVGGGSHPQIEMIYAMLDSLTRQMTDSGYAPDINFALHDVEDKEKEDALFDHSEKLALAFGLINTCDGTPLRIMKNLRVCGDCHSAIKFISKAVKREIFLRDNHRFHHFKDGLCSCRDYW